MFIYKDFLLYRNLHDSSVSIVLILEDELVLMNDGNVVERLSPINLIGLVV